MTAARVGVKLDRNAVIAQRVIHLVLFDDRNANVVDVAEHHQRRVNILKERDRRLRLPRGEFVAGEG